MRINAVQAIYIILISGACTFFLRAIPFILFGNRKKIPTFLTRLGDMLPPAIMAVLVIYCLKDVINKSFLYNLPELISSTVVVLIHLWRRNTILSVFCGTLCYIFILQMVI